MYLRSQKVCRNHILLVHQSGWRNQSCQVFSIGTLGRKTAYHNGSQAWPSTPQIKRNGFFWGDVSPKYPTRMRRRWLSETRRNIPWSDCSVNRSNGRLGGLFVDWNVRRAQEFPQSPHSKHRHISQQHRPHIQTTAPGWVRLNLDICTEYYRVCQPFRSIFRSSQETVLVWDCLQ